MYVILSYYIHTTKELHRKLTSSWKPMVTMVKQIIIKSGWRRRRMVVMETATTSMCRRRRHWINVVMTLLRRWGKFVFKVWGQWRLITAVWWEWREWFRAEWSAWGQVGWGRLVVSMVRWRQWWLLKMRGRRNRHHWGQRWHCVKAIIITGTICVHPTRISAPNTTGHYVLMFIASKLFLQLSQHVNIWSTGTVKWDKWMVKCTYHMHIHTCTQTNMHTCAHTHACMRTHTLWSVWTSSFYNGQPLSFTILLYSYSH